MDRKIYEQTKEKEFIGRRVRSLVELKNGWGSLPAGRIFTIERKYKGFSLLSDPCPTCGLRLSISRVQPRQIELLDGVIQWAIYDHPKDYPDKFVVRRWKIEAGVVTPDPECHLADSLLEARLFIPNGLVRTSHMHGDDPVIVETWI